MRAMWSVAAVNREPGRHMEDSRASRLPQRATRAPIAHACTATCNQQAWPQPEGQPRGRRGARLSRRDSRARPRAARAIRSRRTFSTSGKPTALTAAKPNVRAALRAGDGEWVGGTTSGVNKSSVASGATRAASALHVTESTQLTFVQVGVGGEASSTKTRSEKMRRRVRRLTPPTARACPRAATRRTCARAGRRGRSSGGRSSRRPRRRARARGRRRGRARRTRRRQT